MMTHNLHTPIGLLLFTASPHLFKRLGLFILLPVQGVVVQVLPNLVVQVQDDSVALFSLLIQSVILQGG